MSSLKPLRTPRFTDLQVLEVHGLVVLECSLASLPLSSSPTPNIIPISYAGRRTETGFTGSGGRLSFVQEGAGFVCSPEARGSLPPGLQNQHRPRGAAPLQGLLLQGTGG